MAEHIIIVENEQDWLEEYPALNVITSKNYLADSQRYRSKGIRIVNLCRGYQYLSEGYYCSLLAEARQHKIIPSVRTLTNLSRKSIYSLDFDDLERQLQKLSISHFTEISGDEMELLICFGQTSQGQLPELARMLYELFPCPLMKVVFRKNKDWQIKKIKSISITSLKKDQREFFVNSIQHYLTRRWRIQKQKSSARYDMAILYNPNEKLPPSNMAALRKFIEAGKRLGLDVELIQQKDYSRLGEYDALFIRETTSIDNYTYRFARKAESEGMVIMDDPNSIVRCTNKVYLTELLQLNNIPIPKSVILHKGDDLKKLSTLGYPVVLKIPDGSFSRGIYKAENAEQSKKFSQLLFKESDLILAQEYMYTEFDWRVGIINRSPIFVSQYFMSKAHWQIVKHKEGGAFLEGGFKTWDLEHVSVELIEVALKAANLIGDGFYGVDIKQTANGYVVIEVNDNPNADAGVEDKVLGNELYDIIMKEFLRRLEKRTKREEDVV
ncbi:MAG: RimK family protein [Gammaproteobacteria bacterium]|nr:RimK family protein [Gammaproteobacteria bacterium]MCW8987794.1 RimK family protein [Gammaproteobacteria bacterium]